jgi:dynein heavy chain
LYDEPEIFGMHSNAEYVYQLNETDRMLRSLASMMPKKSGGGSGKDVSEQSADDSTKKTEEKKDTGKGKDIASKPKMGSGSLKTLSQDGTNNKAQGLTEQQKIGSVPKKLGIVSPDDEVMAIAKV